MPELQKVVLSRTDSIGDVVLTLPLAGYLKSIIPDVLIYFIGKKYTHPIIDACVHIDFFLDKDDLLAQPLILQELNADVIIHIFPDRQIANLAKRANIPVRIGTGHRLFHWLNCNRLVNFSRKNSSLHESQLNFLLLKPLGFSMVPDLNRVPELYGLERFEESEKQSLLFLFPSKIKIILHPKSKGSAREWPLSHYHKLIRLLPGSKFEFFITGTEQEGIAVRSELPEIYDNTSVHDMTGKLSLAELISFIRSSDLLIACSTGPLHLAAAAGIHAFGIYPPMRPIHPGRWGPVGKRSKTFVLDKNCNLCKNSQVCACILSITPEQIAMEVQKIYG
jgi:heptosyltransferase-3